MVPESTRRAGPFEGNGVTTSFAFTFKTNVKEDLRIVKLALGIEADLTLDSDYSVTLNADQEASPGGSITYPISGSPLAADEYLTIISDIAIQQTADLPNLGAFYPTVIEDALDRAVMLIGQLQEVLNRAIVLQPSTSGVTVELPTPSANLGIGWNSTGTALANIASVGAMTFTATGTALANAADAAAARTILGGSTVGSAVFTSATAGDARTALGLGSMSTEAKTITTKGDLLVGGAAGALARQAVGTDGQVLTADSAEVDGVKWATPPVAATQAEMEAAASAVLFASPARMQYHPGVAKAWLRQSTSGGTPTRVANYNVTSITDNGAGDFTANFGTPFSSTTSYGMVGTSQLQLPNANTPRAAMVHTYSTGSCRYTTDGSAGTAEDNHAHTFIAWFGDQ